MLKPARSAWVASLVYFGIVFAAGFVLGCVRVLVFVPLFGEQSTELLELAELPVMTIISYQSAAFVVRKYLIQGYPSALIVGLCALAIMLVLEFTVVLSLRGLSIEAYLGSRNTVAGYAYALSLVLYAIFPVYITSSRHRDDI